MKINTDIDIIEEVDICRYYIIISRPAAKSFREIVALKKGNPYHDELGRFTNAPIDVTEEYLRNARPGKGKLEVEPGYKISGHQDEIATAKWLIKTFGGDIRLIYEHDGKYGKTSDYLWNNKRWELKSTGSINGADKLLQEAIRQIRNNPGGVILELKKSINFEELEKQLIRRVIRSEIDELDLMIVRNEKLIKVNRYKK